MFLFGLLVGLPIGAVLGGGFAWLYPKLFASTATAVVTKIVPLSASPTANNG